MNAYPPKFAPKAFYSKAQGRPGSPRRTLSYDSDRSKGAASRKKTMNGSIGTRRNSAKWIRKRSRGDMIQPTPLARYRPKYPFLGCVPAEPESVFPGSFNVHSAPFDAKNHWTQEFMPQKIHFETGGDFRRRRRRFR